MWYSPAPPGCAWIWGGLAAAMSPRGSWPMALVSVLFAFMCTVIAVGVLVVPMEDAVLWHWDIGKLMLDLQRGIGEWGARIVVASLFGFCAYAAGKTAYVRIMLVRPRRPA